MKRFWSATGVMRSVTASSDGAATQPTCCASPKHAYNLLRTKRHLWSRSNLLIEFALLILTLSGGAFRATLTSSVRSSRRSRLGRIRARSHVPDAVGHNYTEAARRSRRTRAALRAHHPHKGPRTREKGQLGREDVQHKQHGARESGAPRNPATNRTLVCLP